MHARPSDEEMQAIVAAARAGDHDAFTALYDHTFRALRAFLRHRFTPEDDDLYDVLQDTYIKALTKIADTEGHLDVLSWFHRIARNSAIDLMRSRTGHPNRKGVVKPRHFDSWDEVKHDHIAVEDDHADAILGGMASAIESEATRRILRRLRPLHRDAMTMHYFRDMGTDQIGAALGLTRMAVKAVLFRARDEFRQKVAEDDEIKALLLNERRAAYLDHVGAFRIYKPRAVA